MAKIKMTKTEMKTQRDALKQFMRFLPTLQLKKQQLQMEIRKSQELLRKNEAAAEALRQQLGSWIALFGTADTVEKLTALICLDEVRTGESNIAGVQVPIFDGVKFKVAAYDLFSEELWLDNAIEAIQQLISIQEEHKIIEEQYNLLAAELRTTTQRVNLFEKVKIPECQDNIRRIRIYLGDMDTSAVARSKIAKGKAREVAA
ncbi:MAG: V-type ATP synthase subunit D [Victivallaceae bacterium]|nr:V-type ATP synthase subunit D [Victivallaceae bacterium]